MIAISYNGWINSMASEITLIYDAWDLCGVFVCVHTKTLPTLNGICCCCCCCCCVHSFLMRIFPFICAIASWLNFFLLYSLGPLTFEPAIYTYNRCFFSSFFFFFYLRLTIVRLPTYMYSQFHSHSLSLS